jgi:hypothetical protein
MTYKLVDSTEWTLDHIHNQIIMFKNTERHIRSELYDDLMYITYYYDSITQSFRIQQKGKIHPLELVSLWRELYLTSGNIIIRSGQNGLSLLPQGWMEVIIV